MPKQQSAKSTKTTAASDLQAFNKLYQGSWCDFPDWNSWKQSKIAIENIQLPVANFTEGVNSRQLRYVNAVVLQCNSHNRTPYFFLLHAYISKMNRASGVEVLRESIRQMGWDTTMSKFIVVPTTPDYQRFLDCLPDAVKACSPTLWESKSSNEAGFNTHFMSSSAHSTACNVDVSSSVHYFCVLK